MHAKTQQVVMEKWKKQFRSLFDFLKLVPKEIQVKAQRDTRWHHCEAEMLSKAAEEHIYSYSKKTYVNEVDDDGKDAKSEDEIPPGLTATELMERSKQLIAAVDGYKRQMEV